MTRQPPSRPLIPQRGGVADSDRTERLPLANLRSSEDQNLNATLTMLKGPSVGLVYAIQEGITLIGRSQEAAVHVVAEGISRRHAQITASNGKYLLTDLGSTNGTICRGTLLDEPIELMDGDRINLGGRVILRFAKEGALEAALRERVYTLATRDPLTSAFNRHYFQERLSSEWAWAIRHAHTCAVLMIDVDHFKAINDTHGHSAGDVVLQGLANILAQTLRREDLLARVGGEEFVVLCRATDRHAAVRLAERLRERVADASFNWAGAVLRVTISVGVATSDDAGVAAPSELIERADEHLYRAKEGGRNQVAPRPQESRPPT